MFVCIDAIFSIVAIMINIFLFCVCVLFFFCSFSHWMYLTYGIILMQRKHENRDFQIKQGGILNKYLLNEFEIAIKYIKFSQSKSKMMNAFASFHSLNLVNTNPCEANEMHQYFAIVYNFRTSIIQLVLNINEMNFHGIHSPQITEISWISYRAVNYVPHFILTTISSIHKPLFIRDAFKIVDMLTPLHLTFYKFVSNCTIL